MIIDCPQCSQRIDLGDEPPPSFSCPTCNGHIQLQIKAEAISPPVAASASPKQRIKRPVLISAITGAVVLTLLVGWMIFGGDDPASEGETPIGKLHEQNNQSGKMSPEEEAVVNALKHYWSASTVEKRQLVVRMQADTVDRMRQHYEYVTLKPREVKLVGIHAHMQKVNRSVTYTKFDTGATLPEGFVFAEYIVGSKEELAKENGSKYWSILEFIHDSNNNINTAKIDWESHVGWNKKTIQALRAQREQEATVVRCLASMDKYNLSLRSEERSQGWRSIEIRRDFISESIYCAVPANLDARDELINKLNDGEGHHIMLEISHRGEGFNDFAFIITNYISDSWFVADEEELFSRLEKQAEIQEIRKWWYGYGYGAGRRLKSYSVELGGARIGDSRMDRFREAAVNEEVIKYSDEYLLKILSLKKVEEVPPDQLNWYRLGFAKGVHGVEPVFRERENAPPRVMWGTENTHLNEEGGDSTTIEPEANITAAPSPDVKIENDSNTIGPATSVTSSESSDLNPFEIQQYMWANGDQLIRLMEASEGIGILSSIQGDLVGGGTSLGIGINERDGWSSGGLSNGFLRVGSMSIKPKTLQPFGTPRTVRMEGNSRSIRLIKASEGFAYLSGIEGDYGNGASSVRVRLQADGWWYMEGRGNRQGRHFGFAIIIPWSANTTIPQVASFQWKKGDPPKRMLHKDEGFCFLAGIVGGFTGGGEEVKIYIGDDGYWYLHGKTTVRGTAAEAAALRFFKRNDSP